MWMTYLTSNNKNSLSPRVWKTLSMISCQSHQIESIILWAWTGTNRGKSLQEFKSLQEVKTKKYNKKSRLKTLIKMKRCRWKHSLKISIKICLRKPKKNTWTNSPKEKKKLYKLLIMYHKKLTFCIQGLLIIPTKSRKSA